MTVEPPTRPEFVQYYARESETTRARERFTAVRDTILRFVDQGARRLDVADIGCNTGTGSLLWSQLGHRVHALDISPELIALARERATRAGQDINFQVGSATSLPWPGASMDICCAPELLEHIRDWKACLDEFTRILRPSGLLFLSTTNRLCPRQQEFDLPLYSWYPASFKRYCERLAMTTRPALAGHATFPAVNWFTFYQLRAELAARGLHAYDRFDTVDLRRKGRLARLVILSLRRCPPLRWLGHVATPSTLILAVKKPVSNTAATRSVR